MYCSAFNTHILFLIRKLLKFEAYIVYFQFCFYFCKGVLKLLLTNSVNIKRYHQKKYKQTNLWAFYNFYVNNVIITRYCEFAGEKKN